MLSAITNFLNTYTLMRVDEVDVSTMLVLMIALIIGVIYVKVKGETFF
jgi:hypothetical protein